ncbi:MAG: hypothetical protein EA396_09360 [Anaerolineaceae bacterium]|nr:MAG: hypothetical protein EA396_09360 [Anaerolineaceae bacterium]
MQILDVVLSIFVGGVVLFLWTGLAQNIFTWGVRSVQQHDGDDTIGGALAEVSEDGMLYVKDRVAAFIAIKPTSYYSTKRYFIIEFITQLAVGCVITAILLLTDGLADGQRVLIIGLVGLAGVASIDLQYWNWWGFSSRYTLGVAVNRLVGYLLATVILINWIL